MILTDLQKFILALVLTAAVMCILAIVVEDRLHRARSRSGWPEAANHLAIRMGRQRESHNSLVAAHEQLANHVGHLAADVERLRAQLAARPPSATDQTVRLGPAAATRTARLARLDPTWPTTTNRSA